MLKLTKRRILVLVVILLVAAGGFFFRLRSTQAQKAQIKTAKVVRADLVDQVTSSGKTKAKEQADLHFQTSGKLAWVGVKEGDTVSAGQALATLDTSELQKNLEKALRDYSKERNDFEEDKRDTYKDKVLTDTVKRILEKNQWDLEKAIIDVEIKDTALRLATLTTPISGIIVDIDTPVAGVNVTATDTITVANLESIVFSASVDEIDVGKIAVGQTATITLDAFPNQVLNGTVSQVAYASETSTAGATVFPVEIVFTAATDLRLGLNGDVAIVIKSLTAVVTVPADAVKETTTGETFVVKKTPAGFDRVPVQIGISASDTSQIISGIDENEEVVIDGFQFLPKEVQIK